MFSEECCLFCFADVAFWLAPALSVTFSICIVPLIPLNELCCSFGYVLAIIRKFPVLKRSDNPCAPWKIVQTIKVSVSWMPKGAVQEKASFSVWEKLVEVARTFFQERWSEAIFRFFWKMRIKLVSVFHIDRRATVNVLVFQPWRNVSTSPEPSLRSAGLDL